MDITYIPMARGFIYLAAVIDWFTRRILSWRVSITLEAAFCIEAVEEALARYSKRISSTAPSEGRGQGSQFTSVEFIKVLAGAEVKISMDGKGAQAGTTSSSSAFGGRSNIRRSICTHTPACQRPDLRLGTTSDSTMVDAHTRRLTEIHPIRLTSMRSHQSRWQHNRGGNPLTKRPDLLKQTEPRLSSTRSDNNTMGSTGSLIGKIASKPRPAPLLTLSSQVTLPRR